MIQSFFRADVAMMLRAGRGRPDAKEARQPARSHYDASFQRDGTASLPASIADDDYLRERPNIMLAKTIGGNRKIDEEKDIEMPIRYGQHDDAS